MHLSAVGEHVKLTCSDGNLSIEMSILADVKEEGTAVLPGRLFTELSRKLPGGEVTIRVGEIMRHRFAACPRSRIWRA